MQARKQKRNEIANIVSAIRPSCFR